MENHTPGVQQILAKNIKDARKKLGYSQQTLAERAEISPGHMNDLEQGRKWVSAVTLERLAGALGLEAYMLMKPGTEGSHVDAFDLLTEYSTLLSDRIQRVLDDSLHEALAKRNASRK